MTINTKQARAFLRAFDFKNLFIEELEWDKPGRTSFFPIRVADLTFDLRGRLIMSDGLNTHFEAVSGSTSGR